MPRVSVIIPAHNRPDLLKEAIESVFNQTFTDYHVWVIDDASDPPLHDVLPILSDPRITYLRQDHGRQARARNRGILSSTGPYIAFLDSDDRWLPHKLKRQVDLLDSRPKTDLVYGWIHTIDENGRRKGEQRGEAEGLIYDQLFQANVVIGGMSMILVRREVFFIHGLFDPSLDALEDWDFFQRISASIRFGVVRDHLAEIRHHSSNFTLLAKRIIPVVRQILHRNLNYCSKSIPEIRTRRSSYEAAASYYIFNRFWPYVPRHERLGHLFGALRRPALFKGQWKDVISRMLKRQRSEGGW